MDLKWFNNKFNYYKTLEEKNDFLFEPQIPKTNRKLKRHINFVDLKEDFTEDLERFGFVPFLKETFRQQMKNKNILKYKKKFFNYGMSNFVKRANKTRRFSKTKEIPEPEKEGTIIYNTLKRLGKIRNLNDNGSFGKEKSFDDNEPSTPNKSVLPSTLSLNQSRRERKKSDAIKKEERARSEKNIMLNLSCKAKKQMKDILRDKYYHFQKNNNQLHPVLSMSNLNVSTAQGEKKNPTWIQDYHSKGEKKKTVGLIKYPEFVSGFLTPPQQIERSASQPKLKLKKRNTILKLLRLEKLEKSPDSIFKRAVKIKYTRTPRDSINCK